ncbi:MAG: hypothetical protein EOM02_08560 [Synergistales bacterium]|nr:hypothetical protein [Synergistales bacterium]
MLKVKSIPLALALLCIVTSLSWGSDVRLTADNMHFDTKTGLLLGTGNVTLTRETLVIKSNKCEGDYKGNSARMWDSVKADGDWNGQVLDFSCDELKASFSNPESVAMAGSVKGSFGDRSLECYDVEMVGDRFIATKVKRFQDKSEGFSLSCNRIKGLVQRENLHEFEAEGSVSMEIVNRKDGSITKISGGKAVYSKDRGSIIMSGGAVAVQKGRKVKAQNIIFYPATNKIEAKGKPSISFEVE